MPLQSRQCNPTAYAHECASSCEVIVFLRDPTPFLSTKRRRLNPDGYGMVTGRNENRKHVASAHTRCRAMEAMLACLVFTIGLLDSARSDHRGAMPTRLVSTVKRFDRASFGHNGGHAGLSRLYSWSISITAGSTIVDHADLSCHYRTPI